MASKKVNEKKLDSPIVNINEMPEIFCDGMSQLLMGVNVSKVVFHTVTNANGEESSETKKAALTLIMTTPALIRTCKRILEAAKKSADGLINDDENKAKMKKMLDEITFES